MENKINIDILNTAQAMQTVCNSAEYASMSAAMESTLRGVLPHGDGIDSEWRFEFKRNCRTGLSTVCCFNQFHRKNNDDKYIGWVYFGVTICIDHRTEDDKIDFKMTGKFTNRQDTKKLLYERIRKSLNTL